MARLANLRCDKSKARDVRKVLLFVVKAEFDRLPNGRNMRLTDVAGEVVKEVLA